MATYRHRLPQPDTGLPSSSPSPWRPTAPCPRATVSATRSPPSATPWADTPPTWPTNTGGRCGTSHHHIDAIASTWVTVVKS